MSANESIDVLLVEDNPNDAELTMRTLKKHNLANRLVWVKDGEAALDYLFHRGEYAESSAGLPRVVLLDLHLPKVEGMEVLAQVRANRATEDLPVVILTSSKEEKDLVAAYKLGVNSYVSKPVAFEDFAKTVAEMGLYWLLINQVSPEIRHQL
jgi:CheY-like chemotaxis protein